MKMKVSKDTWQPADGKILEPNALEAIKNLSCQIVIAGPGAGKTELLAQRACYLLQTDECKNPKRILAISFKRDAAQNLRERVEKRCGKELARRFDSMTFDAFSKSLLDRFMDGIPDAFRPKREYKILTNDSAWQNFFEDVDRTFALSHNKNTLKNLFLGNSLPLQNTPSHKIASNVWDRMLKGSKKSLLTFPMISRVAELLLRENPILVSYLRQTYSFVFLDEFQDTTNLQYDLLKVCFLNSPSILTAVGDNRQRIMVWAGALKDSFNQFETDFAATQTTLLMNYRSAPRLVELQKKLSQSLLNQPISPTPSSHWQPTDGIAEIWRFGDHQKETVYLASQIKSWILNDGVKPRDICVLVKQQVSVYGKPLIDALNKAGINARDENFYQDRLTEDIVAYLLNFLSWILKDSAVNESQWVIDFIGKLENVVSTKESIQLEKNVSEQRRKLKIKINSIKSENDWMVFIKSLLEIINFKKLEAYYPDYRASEYLENLIDNFFIPEFIFWLSLYNDPVLALDCVAGETSIPVMTIHKSKGLEYDTVIFLGLEDDAFWNFRNQPEEDKCTFFVAMSRAKRRIIFTFSESRLDKDNRITRRRRVNISSLYEALQHSGIVEDKAIS